MEENTGNNTFAAPKGPDATVDKSIETFLKEKGFPQVSNNPSKMRRRFMRELKKS